MVNNRVLLLGGLLCVAPLACLASTQEEPPATLASQVIGTAGGTVSAPDGTSVQIPAGALAVDTSITLTPAPGLTAPADVVWIGTPYSFGPNGTQFALPVTVTLAFSPDQLPAGISASQAVVYTAPAGSTSYTSLGGAPSDTSHLQAETTHFSVFGVGVPGSASGGGGTASAITAGSAHTCAIVNGGVQCWGLNATGQLGNDSTTESHVPVAVQGLTGAVQAVTAGGDHSCAVVNGGAWCWGGNDSGQLGDGSTSQRNIPVPVSGLESGVSAMAAGSPNHTCALVSGGVQCWGYNFSGELGDGTTAASDVPVQVAGLTGGVLALSAGYVDACALLATGAECWGHDPYGEVGNGVGTETAVTVPVAVDGLEGNPQAIAAGGLLTCALVGGSVACVGYNNAGDLGAGLSYTSTTQSLTPVPVSNLSGVQAIAVGFYHGCALTQAGGVQCWGDNSMGQLGAGSIGSSAVPVAVQGLPGPAQAIVAGDYHTCALVGGQAWCWGDNANGDLGNGSTTQSNVPVQVSAWAS